LTLFRSRSGRIRYREEISGSSRRDLSASREVFGLFVCSRLGLCYRGLAGANVSLMKMAAGIGLLSMVAVANAKLNDRVQFDPNSHLQSAIIAGHSGA